MEKSIGNFYSPVHIFISLEIFGNFDKTMRLHRLALILLRLILDPPLRSHNVYFQLGFLAIHKVGNLGIFV